MIVVGIGLHPWGRNAAQALIHAASALGHEVRSIDLPSLRWDEASGEVSDGAGRVQITHLAPTLLYQQPLARLAYERLERMGAVALNPVAAMDLADDKGECALRLEQSDVPQIPFTICAVDVQPVWAAVAALGGRAVIKRSHGAQGRWVRLVDSRDEVDAAMAEFALDGPDTVVVQPVIEAALGASIRAIVLAGEVIAATLRENAGDWRSNIALGARQRAITLSEPQVDAARAATKALGLGFAGVDLSPDPSEVQVIEVNAAPDFTSVAPHTDRDIATEVIRALVQRPA